MTRGHKRMRRTSDLIDAGLEEDQNCLSLRWFRLLVFFFLLPSMIIVLFKVVFFIVWQPTFVCVCLCVVSYKPHGNQSL